MTSSIILLMSTFQLFVTLREISIIDMCPNSWNCQRKSNITRRVRWSKPIKVGVCCRLAAAQHRVGEKFGLISDLSSDQPLFKLSWVLLKDGKHEPNISSEWRWDGSAPHGTGGREKSWGGNLTKWNKIVMFTWLCCGSWPWLLWYSSAGGSHHSAYFPSIHNLHIYVVKIL